ncbi:MAG: DNA-3-methyladenine glycosylase family protein [Candidatus Thorarchaeota archaeon]|jgi:N-glycosylase/DNA lyase
MKKVRVNDFDLKDTMECGQTFCWVREGDGYINADFGDIVYVEQRGDHLHYESTSGNIDLNSLIRLDDPVDVIKDEIARDEFMRASIDFAPGLRIVKDPFFSCLVSFLCSTRNNIPTIRRMTQGIREGWGPTYRFRGKTFYGMPSPQELSKVTVPELEDLNLAWRANFIVRSTASILDGEIDQSALCNMDYSDAHESLKTLHGVGDKVADCVCLFSLGFLEAFPIDVWIERVIQKHYGIFTESGKSYKKKSEAARNYFGKYAGYAQEYLYYYTRETSRSQ